MHIGAKGARPPERSLLPLVVLQQDKRSLADMLGTIVIVLLLLALFGAWPMWGYSRRWGYTPSGTIGIVLVFLLVVVVVKGM